MHTQAVYPGDVHRLVYPHHGGIVYSVPFAVYMTVHTALYTDSVCMRGVLWQLFRNSQCLGLNNFIKENIPTDWLTDCREHEWVNWLADWMTNWLPDWLQTTQFAAASEVGWLNRLIGWLTDRLIDWLADQQQLVGFGGCMGFVGLVDWLRNWLADKLIADNTAATSGVGWLNGLIDWLTKWLTDRLTDWLTDWLQTARSAATSGVANHTHWLVDWMTYWQTNWLIGRLIADRLISRNQWMGWLMGWLNDLPTDLLIDWLQTTWSATSGAGWLNRLFGWFTELWTDWLTDWLQTTRSAATSGVGWTSGAAAAPWSAGTPSPTAWVTASSSATRAREPSKTTSFLVRILRQFWP